MPYQICHAEYAGKCAGYNTLMSTRNERLVIGCVVLVFILMITLPYLYAAQAGDDAYVFGGFLLNPIDGNSYLAKMYEGWKGDVKFTLPYTAEVSEGGYLFLLYIGLGHLARIIDVHRMLLFHAARISSSLVMLASLHRFLRYTVVDRHVRLAAFTITVIGGGMGWVGLIFGLFTSDFWVAEAYPFLSSYANPHFPLGLALLLYLFTFPKKGNTLTSVDWWKIVVVSFVLGLLMPFGVVLVLAVLLGLSIWELYPRFSNFRDSYTVRRGFWIFLGGVPVLLYDLWVINQDPLLSIWNRQNLTPSPSLVDLLLSLSPILILAIFGIPEVFRTKESGLRLLLVWSLVGLLLLYFPWELQRRFMIGIFIPLCALAASGLNKIAKSTRAFTFLTTLLIVLIIPTNIIVLLASLQGAAKHDDRLYLTNGEIQAYQWIEINTAPDSIILASPDSGLLIPGYTGRRVIYGHPFETANADDELEQVKSFFEGDINLTNALLNRADYLFLGPRERGLGSVHNLDQLPVVYESPDVTIYRAHIDP